MRACVKASSFRSMPSQRRSATAGSDGCGPRRDAHPPTSEVPADGRRLRVNRLRLLQRGLLEELRAAPIHFLLRQIFLARGDRPAVAVRIDKRAHPVAPELIGERQLDLAAGADGAIEERIAVLDK